MLQESCRRLAGRARLLSIVALVSAIAALVLIPSASAFKTDKYWDATMITPDTSVYESFAGDWKRNKIWWNAPSTHFVQLWFDVNGAQYYWKESNAGTVSPFMTTYTPSGQLLHSRGVCRAESNGAQNATCEMFDWEA
jgi:hypothetical protein